MTNQERVEKAVAAALEQVNELLPEESRLEAHSETVLLGPSGRLDSMGLINLVVALEENLEREFQRQVQLADELSRENESDNPFTTVASLIARLQRTAEAQAW